MTDRIFDVDIIVNKRVRVRVPSDVLSKSQPEKYEDVAEEFALGGQSSWPDYVIREDEDFEIDSIREVRP